MTVGMKILCCNCWLVALLKRSVLKECCLLIVVEFSFVMTAVEMMAMEVSSATQALRFY